MRVPYLFRHLSEVFRLHKIPSSFQMLILIGSLFVLASKLIQEQCRVISCSLSQSWSPAWNVFHSISSRYNPQCRSLADFHVIVPNIRENIVSLATILQLQHLVRDSNERALRSCEAGMLDVDRSRCFKALYICRVESSRVSLPSVFSCPDVDHSL